MEVSFITMWRLETQDQVRAEFISSVASLTCRWLSSPVSSYGLLSIPVCVQTSLSCKDTSHVELGPILMISF